MIRVPRPCPLRALIPRVKVLAKAFLDPLTTSQQHHELLAGYPAEGHTIHVFLQCSRSVLARLHRLKAPSCARGFRPQPIGEAMGLVPLYCLYKDITVRMAGAAGSWKLIAGNFFDCGNGQHIGEVKSNEGIRRSVERYCGRRA